MYFFTKAQQTIKSWQYAAFSWFPPQNLGREMCLLNCPTGGNSGKNRKFPTSVQQHSEFSVSKAEFKVSGQGSLFGNNFANIFYLPLFLKSLSGPDITEREKNFVLLADRIHL